MDIKKTYYYIVCLVSLLVLLWGVVDLTSSLVGLVIAPRSAQTINIPAEKEGEQLMDVYYQKRVLYDQLSDSLARIVIAGIVFAYSRTTVSRLEKQG